MTIAYETDRPVDYEVRGGVAWIMMNRPRFHNAQNSQMTYALDDCFTRAVNDESVQGYRIRRTRQKLLRGP